jgi:hypothetical protein
MAIDANTTERRDLHLCRLRGPRDCHMLELKMEDCEASSQSRRIERSSYRELSPRREAT